MSVYKRGKYFYYEFMYQGERYRGSTKRTNKSEALKEEKKIRLEAKLIKGADEESLNLLRKKMLNLNEKGISLEDAWKKFADKYRANCHKVSGIEKTLKYKQAFWEDFISFIQSKFPKVNTLREINDSIAEAYKEQLIHHGKFTKLIRYNSESKHVVYRSPITSLTVKTINEYISQIKHVFNSLFKEAKLIINPFDEIKKLKPASNKHDIFEMDELDLIHKFLYSKEKLNNSKDDSFDHLILLPIFIIGINTGLRRADICKLKWSNINKSFIRVNTGKTNVEVNIPINRPLKLFLDTEKKRQSLHHIYSEYISPELHQLYITNPDGVTYRFKKMLQQLGIKCCHKEDNTKRRVSLKGIHSLRHTFCFLHGLNGTPITTLQLMTGHMTHKMVEYYQLHSSEEAKKKAQRLLEDFDFQNLGANCQRQNLRDLLNKLENKDFHDLLLKLINF